MDIGCIKSFKDFTKFKLAEPDLRSDPFFSWTVSVKGTRGKNCLVVANDAFCAGFFYYGISRDDVQRMNEIILKGIDHLLSMENIRTDLIKRYLEDCEVSDDLKGSIRYTKPRGPKAIARFNSFANMAEDFGGLQDGYLPDNLVRTMNEFEFSTSGKRCDRRMLLQYMFMMHYVEKCEGPWYFDDRSTLIPVGTVTGDLTRVLN